MSGRLLPLHALPAADRNGRVGAGAHRSRARCGSSPARSSSDCYEPPDGFAKAVLLGLRLGALEPRPRAITRSISIRLGAFDTDPGVRPTYRQFVAYAAPWEPLPDDGLTRFPESRSTPA